MPNLPCTIDGTTYERRYAEGPRRKLQVWNGTAYRTCRGGVTKKDLMMYKGHIVYKSRHNAAMKLFRKNSGVREAFKENRFVKAKTSRRRRSSSARK